MVYNRKGTFMTEKGYLIGLRMRLWQHSCRRAIEFPEGYQLSWIIFKLSNKKEQLLFDNHEDKPLHYHNNEKEEFFTWKSLAETEKVFFQMAYQKFGYFNYE